jgi:hypothetical protein
MKHFYLIFLLLFFTSAINAQRQNTHITYKINKTNAPIVIDGLLDDKGWQNAQIATNFFMILPADTGKAMIPTEVRMTYDAKNIYISAVNHIPHQKYVVESLKREFAFQKNDNFLVIMDTYNDITNGFGFGVNAYGAQWDVQQYDGGPANGNWDNKWYSTVKREKDRWIFEGAIPFKSIRYSTTATSWGINFSRLDLTSTEKSSWAPVPRQFPSISSAHMGTLIWDAPPPKQGANISAIPYLLTGATKNFETGTKSNRAELGGDVKVALGSALNLDLTYNPDFSQVEVDRQVTNLDRFELFFPERRQFFLENDDLFNNLGMDRIRPFFSRRIGLGVPINYGARLSGKLNNNLRIGAMNIGTDDIQKENKLGQNFSVLTLQQKIFSRSNITGVIINKDEIGSNKFNRNLGVEYNHASKNNEWRGKVMYYNATGELKKGDNGLVAAQLVYNTRKWNISGQYEYTGSGYDAQVGYLQRVGYHRISPRVNYTFLPKGSKILSHGPGAFNFTFFDKAGSAIEYTTGVVYGAEFRTRATVSWYCAKDYIKLQSAFDPTNFTGIKLPIGSEHNWISTGVTYNSAPQNIFSYGFESRYGGYYENGTRLRLATNLGYRFQPYALIGIGAEINDIDLPEEKKLKDARFWLVSPRIDVTFTNNLYLTTFIQYNQQAKNTNVNARLQWRYKPASDIYLVYTDNYATQDFTVKNRAVVLKFTYWGNI